MTACDRQFVDVIADDLKEYDAQLRVFHLFEALTLQRLSCSHAYRMRRVHSGVAANRR